MRAQRAGESALLLLDAVDVLNGAGISYAVIGAMAASVHGVVRASMDADALLAVPVHELRALEQRFRTQGFGTELRFGDDEDPIAAVLTLTDALGNRVDLLVGLRGLDPAAFARAFEVPFSGGRLRVVGLEDFVAMKLFAHGPQDIEDARFALAAARDTVNQELLQHLTARYGQRALDTLAGLLAQPPPQPR
jgi:hypothetical protein